MKLQSKYLLFIIIVHSICLVLSFFVFRENKIWFVVTELFIIVSIGLSVNIYQAIVQPLNLLVQGADAIKDQDFTVKLVSTGKTEMDRLIDVYNQMIDQLRQERTLQQEQHYFLEKLIQNSPIGIVILDFDKRVQQINPKAKEILQADTKSEKSQLHKVFLDEINILKPGSSKYILHSSKRYKLLLSYFLDRGFQRYFVILEELSEEISLAEKQAYAKVIRMMSHEVNNTIGPVNSILQSALVLHPEAKSSNKLCDAIGVAINRNRNLNLFMRNMADVVRLPEPAIILMDLNKLLRSVANFFEQTLLSRCIELNLQLQEGTFEIYADHLQMEQALINIIKNSIEAIESTEDGEILIITDSASSKLIIRDNGKGLAGGAELYSFPPFFTDKKNGQGIGLTMTKEILMTHGFEFSLSTVKENQTEFVIQF